ncbi:MAG TPA: hypothetical protein VKP65_17525 [Rhodothermales bacterium]|nr:hypothetical protein [Rhodothermales bacterium]
MVSEFPEHIVLPTPLDLTFEGFAPEAFAILERLRQEPHIDQYRKEKEGVRTYLTDPFKHYRDDLVVNWVLPNHLPFETERNVFSRLLKNDFGAGGCHHHLWMAFYRPGLRRLTDVQLSHSIRPEGFEVGLFVGGYAKKLLRQVKAHIAAEPDAFLSLLNPLLQEYYLAYRQGTGERRVRQVFIEPLDAIPDDVQKADAIWLRRRFVREDVLQWEGELVAHALAAIQQLWPLYLFFLKGAGE